MTRRISTPALISGFYDGFSCHATSRGRGKSGGLSFINSIVMPDKMKKAALARLRYHTVSLDHGSRRSHRHLCSYAGLVPSVHASGGKRRLGRLPKQGSSWLRWIFVELSIHAINGGPQFRRWYQRVAKKYGSNVGRVAVARAMVKTLYAMLKHQEAFRFLENGSARQRPEVMAR